jgi:hypothetical protein
MAEGSGRTLEIVSLLIFGLFMLIFGVLLFKIREGLLPYNANGVYGLSLVLQGFLIVAMGRTPFGDFRRSWALVLAGAGVAIFGMSACLLPGFFPHAPRIFTAVLLLTGGITLLLQLLTSERKAWLWISVGGTLLNLTIACALVYVLTAFVGLMTLDPDVASLRPMPAILLVYAACLFYLALSLRLIPEAEAPEAARFASKAAPVERSGLYSEAWLPLSQALLSLQAMLLTLFGSLLILITLIPLSGVQEFAGAPLPTPSGEGQLGLLLVVMAFNAMTLGHTPLGQFKLSPFITTIGLAFAAMGIVSSITPGLLTGVISLMIGLLNLFQGTMGLAARFLPWLLGKKTPMPIPAVLPPEVRKLNSTQTAMNSLQIVFGASMFLPGVVPGILMLPLVLAMGLLLFRLVVLQRELSAPRLATA